MMAYSEYDFMAHYAPNNAILMFFMSISMDDEASRKFHFLAYSLYA